MSPRRYGSWLITHWPRLPDRVPGQVPVYGAPTEFIIYAPIVKGDWRETDHIAARLVSLRRALGHKLQKGDRYRIVLLGRKPR